MDLEDEDEVTDIREQIFHNTVREHIIFMLLVLLLYIGSFMLINKFRRRDREDLYSTDYDEILVYRISLWLCTLSLAVAVGAALLLPFSIASNEVLLLYPNSYYVKWLNSSLVQGLWNYVFLLANSSLFIFLPFAYLFSESSGFVGHKKGVISRVYETFVVLALLAIVVLGMTYVISAVIDPERSGFQTLMNLGSYYLPFLYSCISFLGVVALLVCTPFGFVKLFGVVGQVLVKPHLLRDVDEEFQTFNLEEAFIRRKLENSYNCVADNSHHRSLYDSAKLYTSGIGDLYKMKTGNGNSTDVNHLHERLRELESERKELDKQRTSTAFQRNFVYPIAMLLLLFLTGITVLIVVQNTLELLIGIKALPLSTRQFTLGITSLSKLGPIGAALEVCIIFYLGATSTVGLYTMPWMRKVRPRIKQTSLSLLIINCALVLILSSAQPLLSRIIGITNFDLLGDYGAIEWLGNFTFVLGYNLCFGAATTLCLVNKFTATVRRELCARLGSLFGYQSTQSNQHFNDTANVPEPADCLSTNIETKKSE
ncbi:hypothetical protein HA402_005256 [Bradysia odoriphaga]|nr:hypothetical protein HA402_005256 [Bradysia odoriphaga]